jgi:hypothetical protein
MNLDRAREQTTSLGRELQRALALEDGLSTAFTHASPVANWSPANGWKRRRRSKISHNTTPAQLGNTGNLCSKP